MTDFDCARVEYTQDPPLVQFPQVYNAAVDFIDHKALTACGKQIALIDDGGEYNYQALHRLVNQCGNALMEAGAGPHERVLMCMDDSIEFVAVFWGAIKIGAVPVPVNTRLRQKDYALLFSDCEPRLVVTDAHCADIFRSLGADSPFDSHVVVAGIEPRQDASLAMRMRRAPCELQPCPATPEDVAFWLYTSGSTGIPKGVMHRHQSLIHTAVLFGQGVLGLSPHDRLYSAAKMHFAYGLGNSMTFPFHAAATSVVSRLRPMPENILEILTTHRPTVFFAVPTIYAQILSAAKRSSDLQLEQLRLCVSAGEALPAEIGRRWEDRFGIEIIDGLGTTEMLQTFISNRPGEVRYGTSGKPVSGYTVRLVNHTGNEVERGNEGELRVKGPSAATGYRGRPRETKATFLDGWTRTGDHYKEDEDGFFHFLGRRDDLLKVGGMWVSPMEIETVLLRHELVVEVAVVGYRTAEGLEKPRAFIVLDDPAQASDGLKEEMKVLVQSELAIYKYPRSIEFVDKLPRTTTGKLQRYRLRE